MRVSIHEQELLPRRRKEDAVTFELSKLRPSDAVQNILDFSSIPPDLSRYITLFKTVQGDWSSTQLLDAIINHTDVTAGVLHTLFFETASNIERKTILDALLTRYPEDNETLLLLEALE